EAAGEAETTRHGGELHLCRADAGGQAAGLVETLAERPPHVALGVRQHLLDQDRVRLLHELLPHALAPETVGAPADVADGLALLRARLGEAPATGRLARVERRGVAVEREEWRAVPAVALVDAGAELLDAASIQQGLHEVPDVLAARVLAKLVEQLHERVAAG